MDIAVQTAGSVEAAIELATVNNLSIVDDIDLAQLRTVEIRNKAVAAYYTSRNITPATALTDSGQIFEDIFNNIFQ